jgi:hypothetical protein
VEYDALRNIVHSAADVGVNVDVLSKGVNVNVLSREATLDPRSHLSQAEMSASDSEASLVSAREPSRRECGA